MKRRIRITCNCATVRSALRRVYRLRVSCSKIVLQHSILLLEDSFALPICVLRSEKEYARIDGRTAWSVNKVANRGAITDERSELDKVTAVAQ